MNKSAAPSRSPVWPILLCTLSVLSLIHPTSSVRSRRQTQQLADIIDILGPHKQVDFVAILDRSLGVGEHAFYYSVRPLVEALLRQCATVHPDFVRTAVVTFAKDSTVVYDQISGVSDTSNSTGAGTATAVTKCQLFDDPLQSPWNRVVYDKNPDLRIGTNLNDSFQFAAEILARGKVQRPTVKQVR